MATGGQRLVLVLGVGTFLGGVIGGIAAWGLDWLKLVLGVKTSDSFWIVVVYLINALILNTDTCNW